MEVALCFTTKAVIVNTRENSNNVCVGAYVGMCVCQKKNDQASSKTQTLDSCFSLVGPHQQGEELC